MLLAVLVRRAKLYCRKWLLSGQATFYRLCKRLLVTASERGNQIIPSASNQLGVFS